MFLTPDQNLVIDWSQIDYMNDTVDLLFLRDCPLVILCDSCGITKEVKLVAERVDSCREYSFDVRCVNCKAGSYLFFNFDLNFY